MKRSYIREILDAIDDNTISFAGGLPNEELFPLTQIKDATVEVLKDSKALQYSSSQGDENLREKIAKLYTSHYDFPTSKDEILITTGSQQAFDIISKTFIKDEVIVEEPSYIGALSAFKILGLNTRGFKNISYLNLLLTKNNALYCMSDFQNPNTSSYTKEQRHEIIHILKKNNSYLIEDSAYSFLGFDGEIKKPISSMYKKSFHLGSFSKIIAPGLRVGWIRADISLLEKVLIAKEAIDLHTSTLNQMIINEYLNSNDLFLHLEKIRKEYKDKMEYMSFCLEKYIPSFSFEKPKGGMFIYGCFKEDSFNLAKKSLEKNVAFVPGSVFYHDNRKSIEARLNFTNSSKENIEKGIKEISLLINENRYKQSIWFILFKGRLSSF